MIPMSFWIWWPGGPDCDSDCWLMGLRAGRTTTDTARCVNSLKWSGCWWGWGFSG